MIIALGILCAILLVLLIIVAGKADRAKKLAAKRTAEVVAADRATLRAREEFDAETIRIHSEADVAVSRAQQQVDRQLAEMNQESERVRQHYEAEARRVQVEAETAYSQLLKDVEALRKYEAVRDAEEEVKRLLADAVKEATGLRGEAQTLMEQARVAAANERSAAIEKARDIHEQADARLNQALRDAGRIAAEAEKRAEQIAGEAYTALRDKQLLEQAAEAMRNTIEGYGDRYLIPTHSLLDDLAAEYGYDAAGQSLSSAREQSRRMVEQGQAAACDYVEASRRNTAIQFVVHAFNGSVDATLSRVKSDNYGTLEQKIKDCFAIVNREGSAFRNARILPAYLDARLAELKWGVIVQELALRDREEQRFLKEQERDRLKAEQERQRLLREAEREKELTAAAVAEAEKRFAEASAEQKTATEKELQELRQKLEDATKRELTIAQQTNKGCIYVISNVGSFGEGVYKIGLTRRSAEERVDELNSASVPFEFDIHAAIKTDHAPDLEYRIHQQFLAMRVNKSNLRKEFFRVTLDEIRRVVESLGQGKDASWTEKARAQQYFDSLDIDRNAEAKEKWLKRAQLLAERRNRAVSRPSPLVGPEANGSG